MFGYYIDVTESKLVLNLPTGYVLFCVKEERGGPIALCLFSFRRFAFSMVGCHCGLPLTFSMNNFESSP